MSLKYAIENLEHSRDEAIKLLREAHEAVAAFENYCAQYQQHGISPRLQKWQVSTAAYLSGQED
jgi:hypothetical protein